MQISRSGFYAWQSRKPSKWQQENEALLPLVVNAAQRSKNTYGARRIAREVHSNGTHCGRSRAKTLMNLAGVVAKQKRKFKVTTNSKHDLPVAPNLLNRRFNVKEPDRVYVSDITYIWTQEGWLYLAVVIDLFSRQVVGWSFNNRINRQLVINALRMAVWRRQPTAGLIFHSDRGSQYCSKDFQQMLKTYRMKCSMSRKGDCWDNAVAESFFGSLKTERVFFSRYINRGQAKNDIIDYIEMFYNSHRRHSYLKYVSPREFEKQYFFQKAA